MMHFLFTLVGANPAQLARLSALLKIWLQILAIMVVFCVFAGVFILLMLWFGAGN